MAGLSRIPMPKMWVRCVVGTIFLSVIGGTFLYFTLLSHAPVEDILEANRKGRNLAAAGRFEGLKEEDFYIYFDGENPDPSILSQAKWDLWIKVNDHVDIGNVYLDSCGK